MSLQPLLIWVKRNPNRTFALGIFLVTASAGIHLEINRMPGWNNALNLGSLMLVTFFALLLGIFSYWWFYWRSVGKEFTGMGMGQPSDMDVSDLFFQPRRMVSWLEQNVERLQTLYADLERISQLLSFINYSLELSRQLKVALNLAHEIFPNVQIMVFLARGNQLSYEVGTRRGQGNTLETIAPEDARVTNALAEIKSHVDLMKLQETGWKCFALPISHQRPNPEITIMPLLLWNRVLGVIAYDSTDRRRPMDSDERMMATLLNRQMAIFTENHYLYNEKIQQERLRKEVEIARQVQNETLPSVAPPFHGFDIFGSCNPCNEISGDYYDLVPLSGERLLVALADVSGKGLPSALFLSKLQTLVRAMAEHYDSPAKLLTFLSRHMTSEKMGSLFATMILVVLKKGSSQAVCASAGHCKPLVIRTKNGFVEEIPFEVGIPLGLFEIPEDGYQDQVIDLMPADGIILFSDGVTDLTNPQRERYGIERIRTALENAPTNRASSVVYHLMNEMNRFKGQAPLEDDVTMVFIKSEPKTP